MTTSEPSFDEVVPTHKGQSLNRISSNSYSEIHREGSQFCLVDNKFDGLFTANSIEYISGAHTSVGEHINSR